MTDASVTLLLVDLFLKSGNVSSDFLKINCSLKPFFVSSLGTTLELLEIEFALESLDVNIYYDQSVECKQCNDRSNH